MIKKLQALKAKKGFTLVELVVVIAIIGVLAAILIPTMLGVVQDSRITSADSLAKQIKDQTNTFITKMDTAKRPLKAGNGDIKFKVTNGSWTVNGAEVGSWGSGADWSGSDINYNYTAYMADIMRDLKNASVSISLKNNAVDGVAVVDGDDSYGTFPTATDWSDGTFDFGGTKAGVYSDGVIIGTAPKLNLST